MKKPSPAEKNNTSDADARDRPGDREAEAEAGLRLLEVHAPAQRLRRSGALDVAVADLREWIIPIVAITFSITISSKLQKIMEL